MPNDRNSMTSAPEKNMPGSAKAVEIEMPPPAYLLTSPCLPPVSPKHQSWPLDPPVPFIGHPAYPAGPPLLKVAYPKDIPGPTYACPKCEGRFLYYRPSGTVECPFCYSSVSIGRYARYRALSFLAIGLVALCFSLMLALMNITYFDFVLANFVVVGFLVAVASVLLFNAYLLCARYGETDRIEFTN